MLQQFFTYHLDVWIFVAIQACICLATSWWIRASYPGSRLWILWTTASLVVGLGSGWAIDAGTRERLRLQRTIEGLAPTYAYETAQLGHSHIDVDTDVTNPEYLALLERQKIWVRLSPEVCDIYTFRVDTDGKARLIVDSETDYDLNGIYEGERESRTQIGEEFDPFLKDVPLDGKVDNKFSEEIVTDRWGVWVCAYAPIRREDGSVDAILGVDLDAYTWVTSIVRVRVIRLLISTSLVLMLCGTVLAVSRLRFELLERKRLNEQLQSQATSLAKANDELAAARDRAESATRAKSDFLANMSHEIRTPMTAILGFTDFLLEEDGFDQAPPSRVEAIHTIQRNGNHLLHVINDILDLSKIESGKLQIEWMACNPNEIVEQVETLMRARAEEKGLQLHIQFESKIPPALMSDPTRLRQIIFNLVGNAIKFTEKGEVRMLVRSSGGNIPQLEIEIIDSGIGMSLEQQRLLFNPFTQADASMGRRFGGTGLGLTISRRLAQLMGGDVEIVESNLGVGTRFRLSLPLHLAEQASATAIENTTQGENSAIAANARPARVNSLQSYNILLAEDGLDNQRLIAHVLRKAGAEVTLVDNGQLALEAVSQAEAAGRSFHVILMDMQMPVLDGYCATSQLRERGYRGAIIALTAHALKGDRDKCLAAGCDEYETKPINKARLFEKILSQLKASTLIARC